MSCQLSLSELCLYEHLLIGTQKTPQKMLQCCHLLKSLQKIKHRLLTQGIHDLASFGSCPIASGSHVVC